MVIFAGLAHLLQARQADRAALGQGDAGGSVP
jgi:hypothetical protein